MDLEYTDSEITDIILTHADVHSVIKKIDKSKATRPDMIHNKLLIAIVDNITESLTILFNRCLNKLWWVHTIAEVCNFPKVAYLRNFLK